jgi:hypothetical protein|nr:MAG TPA: hypothetical protein [Caudoviricetes sp.]
MKTKEILERVLHLINPNLDNTVNKLKDKEIDYFIEHLTQDLEKSLKHWEFKTKQ